ncbi:MAG: AAA family ATPase [Candidatus Aenigmatarchaeota archaeon]
MITKLRLQGWKSHLDSEFNFRRGVNALIGIMGSGKSSAIEAISFALFGTYPNLQTRKVNLDKIVMKRPQQQKRARVELEFTANGKNYKVVRMIEIGKGTTEAQLLEDGKILDVSPQAINKEIERILGMDYELFSRAVYSEQNGIDYFLRIPKGHRKEHIDRMLRLDRFEAVRELATTLLNKIKTAREDKIENLAELEKEKVDEKLLQTKREIDEIKSKLEEKEKIAKEMAKIREVLEAELHEEEEREKRRVEIEKGLERLTSGIEEAKRSLKPVKPDINFLLEKARERLKGKELELDETKKVIDEKRSAIAEIDAKLEYIQENKKRLEKAGTICPICESPLTEEGKSRILQEKEKNKTSLLENRERLDKELQSALIKKGILESEIKQIEGEQRQLEIEAREVERQEEIKGRIKSYEEEIARLQKELSLLPESREKDIRNRLQDAIANEKEALSNIKTYSAWLSDKQRVMQDLIERKHMIEGIKAEIEKERKIEENMAKFISVLKMVQERLRQEFIKNVNLLMEQIWPELYPYQDFESVQLVVDDDYVLQIKETGGAWIPIEGIASGGERSIACLALRIAFSHTFVPNLKWLILDEPTHNLDSNAIEKFATILREKMDEFAEQIFLITHEERLCEGVSGMVYKLEREKGANGATVVKQYI